MKRNHTESRSSSSITSFTLKTQKKQRIKEKKHQSHMIRHSDIVNLKSLCFVLWICVVNLWICEEEERDLWIRGYDDADEKRKMKIEDDEWW